jgi:hypothetical protein
MPLVVTTRTLTGELDQKPLRISYRTFRRVAPPPGQLDSAFLPATVLTVTHDGTEATFEGGQITTVDTPIGTLVTVQLSVVADLGTTTLSFLLPELGAEPASGRSELHTIAIRSLHKSGFAGPAQQGQLNTYTAVRLHGEVDERPVPINAE